MSCFEIYLTIILRTYDNNLLSFFLNKNFVTLNHPDKICVSFVGIRQFRNVAETSVRCQGPWTNESAFYWINGEKLEKDWPGWGGTNLGKTGELAYFWMATRNPVRKPVEVGSLSHYLQGLIICLHINIHPRWWSPDFWSINIMFSTAWKGRGVEGTWAWEVRFFLEKEVHCLKLSWFSTFRSILPSVFFMGSLIAVVIISNSQWWYTKPNSILTWVCFFLSKANFLSTPQILTWNLKMMGFQKHPDFPVADVQVHDKTCQG